MSQRLNQLLERLEHVFTQRKRFLADAAHELRTPIAALTTTLELAVRRPRDNAALTEAIHSSLSNAKLLRHLVETLMEQARSDHPVFGRDPEMADVVVILDECARAAELLGKEKPVQLISDFPSSCMLKTQPDRLRSVALNLLTNAIEYNHPNGTVRISCRCEPGQVVIAVQDTGEGIAPEHLPHVFEPFYRANGSLRGQSAHLGLGLFLVRSHIDAMNGTCEIQSTPGHGTTVTVTLPMTQTVADEPAIPAVASS
jgi:two-component system OmpR family sensor kinase